jgi:transcriptional regulator with XRE-family HTH domain
VGQTRVASSKSTEQVGFGEVLRRYRVAAGLTQEALAERSALSPRGISDLERAARTHPYPTTARRLAELAEPNFATIHAREWLQRLEVDHNNLRASLSWALEEHDARTALRLSSAVWHFWYARGYLTEGSRWLDEALRLADRVWSGPPDAFEVRARARHETAYARALAGAGILAHYRGHTERHI